jgi:aminoglycoside phosphotransferase (APT) family kinase protein
VTRAYVDRRVSDITGATDAAEHAAEQWGLPAPVILRQGMNAIFRCGDTVLRVATPNASAQASIELAETLDRQGIGVLRSRRTGAIEVNGFAVTAWPHVEATPAPIDWVEVGATVRRVHDVAASSLPEQLPQPSPTDFPWWDHETLLSEVGSNLDPAAEAGIRAAIERHRGWDDFVGSDEVVVCHGDVHPGNVIVGADGPVLIDWDLLCLAPRGWDHAALMTWTERWGGDPGVYERFADGYGWSARGDRYAEAFAELRLVAATLMRWKVALVDPAARPEAERRLAHWRGEVDAPAWRAQ